MAVPVAELESLRDALIRARAKGTATVAYDGKTVTYKSDRDMAAAINDREHRIRRATSGTPRSVAFSTGKGL